jgi:hypothetical protein
MLPVFFFIFYRNAGTSSVLYPLCRLTIDVEGDDTTSGRTSLIQILGSQKIDEWISP